MAVSVEEDGRGSHNPEPIELRPFLEQILRGCQAMGKQVATTLRCDEGIVINADKFHFRNILQTIVDNSIKYSFDEVAISVVVEQSNNATTISVSDNGIGIAERHIGHIFDKFYRVSSAYRQNRQGYGLGLYHVRTLVKRSGGDIALESWPGRGTRITITLPKYG